MMKTMDIFERVEKHLLTQNEKSYYTDLKDEISCAYRGKGELKCAVGCLITDAAYDPYIEGQGVLLNEGIHVALEKSLGFKPSEGLISLLDDLQGIHDNTPVESWANELARLREDVEGELYEEGQ